MFQKLSSRFVLCIAINLAGGWAGRAVAQQAPATIRLLPEDEQRKSNGHQHNFYFLPPGITGENYEDAGFFGGKLRPYLAGNDEALGYLDHYRNRKAVFLADRIVSVASFVFYGIKVLEKDKFPQYNSPEQKVAAGVFIGSLLATIFINHGTNQHFQRAVEAYNAGKSRGGLWPRLCPSALGLGSVQGQPTLAIGWAVR